VVSNSSYSWAIDYRGEGGARFGSVAIEPDWEPAIECAYFAALRRGLVPATHGPTGCAIEPVWDTTRGAPILSAARIVVPGESGREPVYEDIPARSDFFRDMAREGSVEMVRRGLLSEGQSYDFEVNAYARDASAERESRGLLAGALEACEVDAGAPLREKSLDILSVQARPAGRDFREDDMRVFVAERVIEEAAEVSRKAGDREVGGLLLAYLNRSPEDSEIFLEVRAQVPALHTDATSASLTFSSETWAAGNAALRLRGQGEILGGWWHYHPEWESQKACAKCPEERRRVCPLSRPFFSRDDVHLHRTVFSKAYHAALLMSDLGGDELDAAFFGWRHGAVVSRGFDVYPG